jgi:hypothetical protein
MIPDEDMHNIDKDCDTTIIPQQVTQANVFDRSRRFSDNDHMGIVPAAHLIRQRGALVRCWVHIDLITRSIALCGVCQEHILVSCRGKRPVG